MLSSQRKRRLPIATEKYEHNMKRRFGKQNPELLPYSWKLNWNIFFELCLSDLDEQITLSSYERHKNENSEKSLSDKPTIIQYSPQPFHMWNENTA